MWRRQEKSHTQATMKCPVGIYRAYHRGLRFFLEMIYVLAINFGNDIPVGNKFFQLERYANHQSAAAKSGYLHFCREK